MDRACSDGCTGYGYHTHAMCMHLQQSDSDLEDPGDALMEICELVNKKLVE